uniref:Uncharacterized protein n=1 Tax=Rhizophora mucronata TaxID=61149 RepID=A0A2P2PE93_RHIMU
MEVLDLLLLLLFQ